MWYMYTYRAWVEGKISDKPNIYDNLGTENNGSLSKEDRELIEKIFGP
jgi:hypothetical protein